MSLTVCALPSLLSIPDFVELYLCLDCQQVNIMLLRTVSLLLLFTSLGMCATLVSYQTEAQKVEAPAASDDIEAVKDGDAAVDANSRFGNTPSDETLSADNQRGDQPEPEADVARDATAKEPGAGNSPAMEALAQEAVNVEQLSSQEETNDIRPVQTNQSPNKPQPQEDESIWSFNSIRNSFQAVHGYFDSLVELTGGHNGVCQYRCRYGENESCWNLAPVPARTVDSLSSISILISFKSCNN